MVRSCVGLTGEKFSVDRHAPQRYTGRGVNCISERRNRGGRARLADAAGRFAALDEMHVDGRYLVDAQNPVVVEVGLLHAPVLQCDLAVERGSEAEDEAA